LLRNSQLKQDGVQLSRPHHRPSALSSVHWFCQLFRLRLDQSNHHSLRLEKSFIRTAASTLAAQGWDDPWLAVDKLQHFAFCFAVTAAAYWVAAKSASLRRHRLAAGCFAGVAAGLVKELGDVLKVRWIDHTKLGAISAQLTHLQTCHRRCRHLAKPHHPSLLPSPHLPPQWWPGALSVRDLGADGVGVAAALVVLVAAEATARRRRALPARQQQLQQDAERSMV